MQSVFEIVFKIGAHFTNSNVFKYFRDFKIEENKSKEKLRELQKNKLQTLIQVAKKYSKYYRDINDQSIRLEEIKVITKKEIISHKDELVTNFEKNVKWVETSGTSGETLYYPKGLHWDTINRAVMFNYYSWYNVNPWDRNGYFWGFNNKGVKKYKTMLLDVLQNRFRLFSYEKKEVVRFLKKLKSATYLHGYSSMIYETAKISIELGYTPANFPKLKMIKGTSEKIYPFYQESVIKAFGKKIISEYGAAETGIIAYECPLGHMHINEENVIVEQDEEGEIIVTNLNSFSFPIIRYALGDKVKISSYKKCTCGLQSDIIDEVEGRVGKKIQGFEQFYPSLTLYYIFKNLTLNHHIELQYQGFQTLKGELILRFSSFIDEAVERLILQECTNYFNQDVNITIVSNYDIHYKKSKLRDFITELE